MTATKPFAVGDRVMVTRSQAYAGRAGSITKIAEFVPHLVLVILDGDSDTTSFYVGGARGCELAHMPKPS